MLCEDHSYLVRSHTELAPNINVLNFINFVATLLLFFGKLVLYSRAKQLIGSNHFVNQ